MSKMPKYIVDGLPIQKNMYLNANKLTVNWVIKPKQQKGSVPNIATVVLIMNLS